MLPEGANRGRGRGRGQGRGSRSQMNVCELEDGDMHVARN